MKLVWTFVVGVVFVVAVEGASTTPAPEEKAADPAKAVEGRTSGRGDSRLFTGGLGHGVGQPFGFTLGRPPVLGGVQGRPTVFGGVQGRPPVLGGVQGRPTVFGGVQGRPTVFGGVQGRPSAFGGVQGRPQVFGGVQGRPQVFGGVQGRPPALGVQGRPPVFGGGFGVSPGAGIGLGSGIPTLPGAGVLAGGLGGTVNPPSDCRHWCRTPQGQAYCCESAHEPPSNVAVVKPGTCPPVRKHCPSTRSLHPPASCSSDGACAAFDKCCFDTCLQQHTCKPPRGFGR